MYMDRHGLGELGFSSTGWLDSAGVKGRRELLLARQKTTTPFSSGPPWMDRRRGGLVGGVAMAE